MDVIVVLVVLALVVAALTTYIYVSSRAKREAVRVMPAAAAAGLKPRVEPAPVARSGPQPVTPPAPPAPPPLFDLDLEPVLVPPPPAEIRWSKQFDPRSGSLDETARLRLIGDLGVVAKEWCIPLLSQAYGEERRPGHRQAALIALTACRSRAAAATFRLALQSTDAAERAIAADGLADLEPPPQQTKPRRIVERH